MKELPEVPPGLTRVSFVTVMVVVLDSETTISEEEARSRFEKASVATNVPNTYIMGLDGLSIQDAQEPHENAFGIDAGGTAEIRYKVRLAYDHEEPLGVVHPDDIDTVVEQAAAKLFEEEFWEDIEELPDGRNIEFEANSDVLKGRYYWHMVADDFELIERKPL